MVQICMRGKKRKPIKNNGPSAGGRLDPNPRCTVLALLLISCAQTQWVGRDGGLLFISGSQRLVSTFGSDTVEWSGVCVCVSDGRAGSRRIQTLPVASQNPQIKRLEFFNFPKSHRMHPTTPPFLLLSSSFSLA